MRVVTTLIDLNIFKQSKNINADFPQSGFGGRERRGGVGVIVFYRFPCNKLCEDLTTIFLFFYESFYVIRFE